MGPAKAPHTLAGTTSRAILGVYYPSWKIYRGDKPSDLRLDLVTHVYYAFARIQPDDGTVVSLDAKADYELPVDGTKGCLPALAKLKRERFPHLRILLSIGGGSGSAPFPGVAVDPAKTRRFCETAQALVQRYDLDGVDIDWEHPADAVQGKAFANLLRALRTYLPSPRYELAAALPCGAWCLQHIDLCGLLSGARPVLDFLHLMAYDFSGPWVNDGMAGHHAAVHAVDSRGIPAKGGRSVASAVQYLAGRNVPLGRVVLGLPVYGRAFPDKKGGKHKEIEYRDLPPPGVTEYTDDKAIAAHCTGPEGEWVSYDNPVTVQRKVYFAKENGLAGTFFWTGSFDAKDDGRSLVVAAHRALQE